MSKTMMLALLLACAGGAAASEPESKTAVSDLYPNDMGPDEIDVSGYPKEMRDKYKVFKFKCAACHTIARPINSQFAELSEAETAELKKQDPKALADERLLMSDAGLWNRYVKRMMAKPGCPVGKDGKAIWEFLVYDSKARKTGPNLAGWLAHRRKLLHEYAEKYPGSYKKLFGDTPAPAEEDENHKKEKKEKHHD